MTIGNEIKKKLVEEWGLKPLDLKNVRTALEMARSAPYGGLGFAVVLYFGIRTVEISAYKEVVYLRLSGEVGNAFKF